MGRGDARIITAGQEARQKLLHGARQVYEAVAASYGPTSGNVAIQKSYGQSVITHDGVTVAKAIVLKDPVEDIGAELLVQASEESNNVSGDGTSATVLLGYHIWDKANQRVAAGYNPMGLRRGIDKAALWIKDELDKLAVPVKDGDLEQVAAISASDVETGKLVADTVAKTGGMGITVEEYAGLGIKQEMVKGIHFEKGWMLPHFATDKTTEEAIHHKVAIFVVERKITQNQDIAPLIDLIYTGKEYDSVLFIGHVSGQALETCAVTNIHPQSKMKVCVVSPPTYGDQELPFLEDVAILTGAKLIGSSTPISTVTADFAGSADKAIITKTTTTIIGGQGSGEDIEARIAAVKEQLKSDKYNAYEKERMEFRLAKLQGNIAMIKVGGASETEAKELKFRVDDAICATKAAKEEGIVPGGAVTLAQLRTVDLIDGKLIARYTGPELSEDELEGGKCVLEALKEPFKQLMENAGEDGGYRLQQVLKAKPGHGFNVKEMSDEPIDLIKAGILDPVKVLKLVVENACSAAGMAITLPLTITIDREWQLEQVAMNKSGVV